MERQKTINLLFLEIVKAEQPNNLSHIKTLCDNYSQYVNSDKVPPVYKELRELNVKYDELHDSLKWLLDIGLLLRGILSDASEDHIKSF